MQVLSEPQFRKIFDSNAEKVTKSLKNTLTFGDKVYTFKQTETAEKSIVIEEMHNHQLFATYEVKGLGSKTQGLTQVTKYL